MRYRGFEITTTIDRGIIRHNYNTGEDDICNGYYCQIYPAGDDIYANQLFDFCIAEKYDIDPFAALLLTSRGITTPSQAEEFFSKTGDFCDPYDLIDMDKAVERIERAVENGEKIAYTWTEDEVPEGYTQTGTETTNNVTIITNSYTPELIAVEVSKIWDDENDQDGLRPDSIIINLLADGEAIETITVTEEAGWTWSFTDLPKYKDQGTEIAYTITEDTVDGYDPTINGFSVINTHVPETVEVTVTKIWNDHDNQGNSRPDHLTVVLLADGEETAMTATLNEANGWTETLTDLPKRMGGEEIAYSWDEVTVPAGYTISSRVTEGNKTTITNDYAAEGKVQFSGTKTLTGRELEDKQFSFIMEDENGKRWTAQNDAEGKFSFEEIAYTEADAGNRYSYFITEQNDEKPGYTYDDAEYIIDVTVADNGDGTLDVTYTVNGEENGAITFENEYKANGSVEFGGTKTLTGRDLAAYEFSFELIAADGNYKGFTKNDADGSYEFAPIRYTQEDAGKTFNYTVTEVNGGKPGYTYDDTEYEIIVKVEDNGDGTLNVTYTVNGEEDAEILFANEYTADATVTISGEKTVGGEAPEDDEVFTFQLKDADGKVLQEVENTGSSITFDEIPYTLEDAGKTYTYTIQESTESNEQYLTDGSVYTVQVALTDKGDGTLSIDWTLEKDGEAAEKIAFDNTPLSHLDIEKTVIGRAGDQEKLFAFKVTLTDEEGTELEGTFPVEGANVTSIESGSYLHLKHGEKATVKCLPVGTKYLVEEDEYAAFETEARNAEGEITEEGSKAEFVNTLKTVSFSVTKEWQGGDNGLITLTLYENGKKMEPQPTYTESNNVYSYTNLPQYTEEGKAIVYAAKEKYMDGYMTIYRNIAPYAQETDMIYNGGTIVNKAVTSFHVKKVWEGLADGEEAPAITLTLLCNGQKVDKPTPTPDKNGWYHYYNLPATVNGEEAVYTVVEEALDGFATSYLHGSVEVEEAGNGDTIVNRKIPKTGDESMIGLWSGMTVLSGAAFILLMKKRKAMN